MSVGGVHVRQVAGDSTPVQSYSNPEREPIRDPDATWGWHHRAGARNGEEWVWGYKAHVLADANYDIPLVLVSSAGKDNDTRYLMPLMDKSVEQHELDTKVVIAYRGYDSARNNEFLHHKGIAPAIHIRRLPKNALFDGIYTMEGVPTCMGGKEMEYVWTGPKTGRHMYRCPAGGCERKERIRGYTTRDDFHWEGPEQNIRLFGWRIRRGSPEWKRTYRKLWSIERVFSRWNTFGRMRSHYFRDLRPTFPPDYILGNSTNLLIPMRFSVPAWPHALCGQFSCWGDPGQRSVDRPRDGDFQGCGQHSAILGANSSFAGAIGCKRHVDSHPCVH